MNPLSEEQLKLVELALRVIYQGKDNLDLSWIEHSMFAKLLDAGDSQSGPDAAIRVVRDAIARTGYFNVTR